MARRVIKRPAPSPDDVAKESAPLSLLLDKQPLTERERELANRKIMRDLKRIKNRWRY